MKVRASVLIVAIAEHLILVKLRSQLIGIIALVVDVILLPGECCWGCAESCAVLKSALVL